MVAAGRRAVRRRNCRITATGKVLKRQLRQEYYDMYQSAAALAGETAAG